MCDAEYELDRLKDRIDGLEVDYQDRMELLGDLFDDLDRGILTLADAKRRLAHERRYDVQRKEYA